MTFHFCLCVLINVWRSSVDLSQNNVNNKVVELIKVILDLILIMNNYLSSGIYRK